MTETFALSRQELKRLEVLSRVSGGQLTAREAAELLELSVRQVRRNLATVREEGAVALAHGNRGRPPAHTIPAEVRTRVVELATSKYRDYNHQHLTEMLEQEGIALSRSTVRRILSAANVRSPRKRRAPKHRQRRDRYAQEGMLLQADGSDHAWLEGRGPRLCLIAAVDDATGKIAGASFRLQEDAQGYMLVLEQVVGRYGVPLALYHDRHGIFVRSEREPETIEEQLAGKREPTQFGRVLLELGIASIDAHSPQAKGRIERLFGTLQDRLVKALRESGAKTLEEANRVLAGFVEEYNARFAVEPAEAGLAYRQLPKGVRLEEVCCFKYLRVVGSDNTVQFGTKRLQILPSKERSTFARVRVEVHERLDGSLTIYHGGRCLATNEAPQEATALRARRGRRPSATPLVQPAGEPTVDEADVAQVTTEPEPASGPVEESKAQSEFGRRFPESADAGPSADESKPRKAAASYVDKWTGERIFSPSSPTKDHPWRTPNKRTMVTVSLNS